MLKNRIIWLPILAASVFAAGSALAQSGPTSGWYQIISGRYTECCGIAGPFIYPLPDARQGFVELTVDPQRNLAQMTFLGEDQRTVFSISPNGPQSGFTFMFTNGMVFADHIQFDAPMPPPKPDQPYFSYAVSNSGDALRINGTVTAPCSGCADLPTEFRHTNIVALLMPTAMIYVSEVEVCWNSSSNRTYQMQYQSALTTNAWTNLGVPVAGNGSTNCAADRVPVGQPRRFYRVLTLH